MALSLDQLTTLTHENVMPELKDNIFTAIPLFFRLNSMGQMQLDGGTKIREPIIYQKTGQAGGFTGTGPLPTTQNDVITGAEFDWVTYQAPLVFDRLEEKKNAGKWGILKLLKNMRQVSELDIRDSIGTDLITGNASTSSTSELDGLQLMVDDDDSPKTYGGIDKDDFTGWVADDTALSAALTVFDMQKMFGRVTIGNDHPTLVLMDQLTFDKYWSLLQNDQRFVDTRIASAGFTTLQFNGIPVMVDPNVPNASSTSRTMYMLNENYIKLYVHKDVNFMVRPFVEPEDQWAAISHILWMGQLTCSNRRMNARLTAVDPS